MVLNIEEPRRAIDNPEYYKRSRRELDMEHRKMLMEQRKSNDWKDYNKMDKTKLIDLLIQTKKQLENKDKDIQGFAIRILNLRTELKRLNPDVDLDKIETNLETVKGLKEV